MPHQTAKLDAFLTHQEFRARFETEKAKVARHYCTLFRFWRDCRFKLCRRVRCCAGEPLACLQLSAQRVPRHLQFAARQRLLETTPRNIAAPERVAHELMPNTLADVSWGAVKQRDIPPGWRRSGRR